MAAPTNEKLKSLSLTLLLCGAVAALAGLAYLFLSPKSFETAARLKVVNWVDAKGLENPSDESVIFRECDLAGSNAVLNPVIQKLNLRELWGQRYHQGTPLSLEESRARLRAVARVSPVPHASVMDIRVSGDDAGELAKIANAIAQSYLEFREARRQEIIRAKVAGLKQQWDAQNDKVRDAQARVDALYFQIVHERSTNQTKYYDSASYDVLVASRAQLVEKCVARRNELDGLKKMDRGELKNVLSSMDANSVLSTVLLQLGKAKSDLLKARLNYAEDSPQVREVTLVVGTLEAQADRQIDATMTVRETELAGWQRMLQEVEGKLKNASTNTAQPAFQDAGYKKALGELQQLKQQRDDMQKQMDDEASRDAIKPTGVTAHIIEAAEPSRRPATPDPLLALGAIIGGAGIAIMGLVLLLVSQRARLVSARPRSAR